MTVILDPKKFSELETAPTPGVGDLIVGLRGNENVLFEVDDLPQPEGGVTSVNSQSGDVQLNADDIPFDIAYLMAITSGFFSNQDNVQEVIDRFGDAFLTLAQQISSFSNLATTRPITRTAHGLAVGDWVRQSGGTDSGSGTYVKAQADSASHADIVGVVSTVIDANNFILTMQGYIASGFTDLTPSTVYYLSPDVPGSMTTTKPTGNGQVIKPMFVAVGTTRGIINIGYAAEIVGENLKTENNLADLSDLVEAKENLELDLVDNTPDADKPVSSAQQTALDDKLDSSEKGTTNGVAELDGTGKVPASQLPGYVDDVQSYINLVAFPVTGEDGIIYIAKDTNLQYRWTGSAYAVISPSIALGETINTAYRAIAVK